jgi:hypothetical protein
MAHMMLNEKRATRGKRMSALVGQAAEEDDAFYQKDIWNEGSDESDAESYSTEEEKPDLFDSDFNESEDSEDEESMDQDEERMLKHSEKVRNTVLIFTYLSHSIFIRKNLNIKNLKRGRDLLLNLLPQLMKKQAKSSRNSRRRK